MKQILFAIFFAFAAQAAHVTFNTADFTTAGQAARLLKISPLSTPTTSGSSIITSDRRTYTNDASGVTTVSNMVAGSYRCELSGAFAITSFQITIPTTDDLINARDYLSTAASAPTASNSWSIAVSDARYVLKSNSWAFGLVSTNSTNSGNWKYASGAASGYVWTSDANGLGSWAAASGGGGSTLNLVTNFSGTATGLTVRGYFTNDGLTASRVVTTDANKALASSSVTSTELGYVSGAAGNLQAQIYARPAVASAVCNGRLTLTTAVPVTTSDVKSAGTIYFTPFNGNTIALYTGGVWSNYAFAELSASLSGYNKGTNWDVFVYDNSGTLTLDLTQWSSDTARATAIAQQDGVSVKTGATGRRLVGTIRTSVVGGCEDSITNRFVSNLYNRAPRKLQRSDATASWTYSTATWRSVNNATANRLEVVICEAGPMAELIHYGHQSMTVNSGYIGIGYDRTNGDDSDLRGTFASTTATATAHARMSHYPAVGYHYYQMVEIGWGSGVNTWYGTSGNLRAGIIGFILN